MRALKCDMLQAQAYLGARDAHRERGRLRFPGAAPQRHAGAPLGINNALQRATAPRHFFKLFLLAVQTDLDMMHPMLALSRTWSNGRRQCRFCMIQAQQASGSRRYS